MAPIQYTGALQPKKKSELQEIAVALHLSEQGTKDELQARIKKHLDANQDALEDDARFAGLFGRRKRSVQPQSNPVSGRFAPPEIEKPRSSIGRRIMALDPIIESTPVQDLRDVSTFLKHSPIELPTTPSSLPPLPPSPSPTKSIIEHLPTAAQVKAAVQVGQQEALHSGTELLIALRAFLSNSRNIWSLSSLAEILYILAVTIPWQSTQLPYSPRGAAGPSFSITYPPASILTAWPFWAVLLHWAIPTFILPSLLGSIISFAPASAQASAASVAPLDPLTASIVRLAAHVAYPYPTLAARANISGLDVLGSNWRILSASVGLAFAFAEAIAGTPQIVANALISERRRHSITFEDHEQSTPVRRALMPHQEDEVD